MKLLQVKLLPMLSLVMFVLLLILGAVYAFSDFQASTSSSKVKILAFSNSKDMLMSFSSASTSYVAGERAVFYVDFLNLRDTPIRRIDFTLRVRALSFAGYQVLEMRSYSTRTFMPRVVERITINTSFPIFTPSGFFVLELTAKPDLAEALPPAVITTYVDMSKYFLGFLVLSTIFSGSRYSLMRLSEHIERVGVKSLPSSLRKLGVLLILFEKRLEDQEEQFASLGLRTGNLSIGQKFVFSGISLLIVAEVIRFFRMGDVTEQLGTLTFFALLIGIVNVIWENAERGRPPRFRLPPKSRLIINLLVFVLLIYFSSPLREFRTVLLLVMVLFAIDLLTIVSIAINSLIIISILINSLTVVSVVTNIVIKHLQGIYRKS
jgi:hypothetical protein